MWLNMGPSFLHQTMGIGWRYPLDVVFIEVCLWGYSISGILMRL